MRLPPRLFLASAMQIAVVKGADGHDKLVANFLSHPLALGKFEVMGMAGLAIAYQARQLPHFFQVALVAVFLVMAETERRLVDGFSRLGWHVVPLRQLNRRDIGALR